MAARDQARPTSGVDTNPAALDATQTEAGPIDEFERQLAATKEALDAADILASMQMEDVLFDGPPAPSDGQPPANFPNANEQFNTIPPPGFNENSPRFNVGSNEALTTGFLPDETIARELERLRARASELETLLARADGVCTPDSERSTADDDGVADDHSAEPSGIPDLSNALLLHGQPHTARDMRSWSPRAREIFEDWVYEERIVMKKKVMIEQLTQARLELFFRTFYHPSPEVERQRPEERPRRSSEPAGEFLLRTLRLSPSSTKCTKGGNNSSKKRRRTSRICNAYHLRSTPCRAASSGWRNWRIKQGTYEQLDMPSGKRQWRRWKIPSGKPLRPIRHVSSGVGYWKLKTGL